MVATADESRLGNSTQKYVFLPPGPPCEDSSPRSAPLNGEVMKEASIPLTPEKPIARVS